MNFKQIIDLKNQIKKVAPFWWCCTNRKDTKTCCCTDKLRAAEKEENHEKKWIDNMQENCSEARKTLIEDDGSVPGQKKLDDCYTEAELPAHVDNVQVNHHRCQHHSVREWVGFNGTSTQFRSLAPSLTWKAGTQSPRDVIITQPWWTTVSCIAPEWPQQTFRFLLVLVVTKPWWILEGKNNRQQSNVQTMHVDYQFGLMPNDTTNIRDG